MKSIHFFIITILLFSNLNAQDKNEYKINWFNTENGLPSNGLKGLQWDYKTNFLWIATEAGIVRFNGIEFHPFTKQNTPYISTERTNFIVKNNLGEIYVSDSKGNLLSISNNKPSPYKSAPENSLLFTQKIYAITVSKILFEEKIKTATESRFLLQFCTVTPVNDKTALILLGEKVYLSQFGEKNSYTPIDNTSEYKSIFKCNADIFSLGTNNIFYKYDTISKSFSKYSLKKDKLNTDYQDIVNGRIHWTNGMEYPIVINKNKAWTLNFSNNSIEATLICSAIPTGSLVKYVQYIKEKDLLFLGTDSKGLLMISKNTLQQIKINKPSKDESNAYYSQVYLGNGSILTNEGTIINVNKKTNNQASPIKGKFNYTTYLTEDSILWYAQYLQNSNNTILHSYNYKTKEAKHYKNITIEEGFGIAKKNDKYYIGTRKGFGIISGDSIRFLTKMSAVKYITNNPFKMGFVNDNEIAIASCNGLALVNTQSGKYEYILSLPDYCIRTFWKYQDYLFIGTYGKGYFIYKKGSAKAMPLDKNNYLLYTHCFIEDKNGFCWISTNRGLFKA